MRGEAHPPLRRTGPCVTNVALRRRAGDWCKFAEVIYSRLVRRCLCGPAGEILRPSDIEHTRLQLALLYFGLRLLVSLRRYREPGRLQMPSVGACCVADSMILTAAYGRFCREYGGVRHFDMICESPRYASEARLLALIVTNIPRQIVASTGRWLFMFTCVLRTHVQT